MWIESHGGGRSFHRNDILMDVKNCNSPPPPCVSPSLAFNNDDGVQVGNSYVTSTGDAAGRSTGTLLDALTEDERQIVQLICEGVSNKEIGRRLNLSEDTVKVHVHNIYRKLAMRNRKALRARSRE